MTLDLSSMSLRERVALAAQIREADELPEFVLEDFRGELYPFQRRAVLFAYVLGRALIADQVGLGKTVEALGLIAFVRQRMEDEGPVIVFVRASAVRQWQAEIIRFLGIAPAVLSGRDKKTRNWILSSEPEIVLVNYELFVRDQKLFEFLADKPSVVVLDEATVFKSRQAKTTRMLREFCKEAQWVVGLSATPVESRLSDIYSILSVLGVPLPKWSDFKAAFVVTEMRQGFGYSYEKVVGYKNLGEALKFVKPWVLRRTAADVGGQLPEVVFREVVLDMPKVQRRIYDEERSAVLQGGLVSLPNFHNLTKICNFVDTGREVLSPKMDFVVDLLKGDLQGQQAIVYATHIATLDFVERRLVREGFSVGRLDGNVQQNVRQWIVGAFNDGNLDVLVANKVIQDSLNLPAASVMFLLDLPGANPARLTQLVGRMRRMGSQHEYVLAILLMMNETHETRLYELLEFREYLALFVSGDSDSLVAPPGLTQEQLLDLLAP